MIYAEIFLITVCNRRNLFQQDQHISLFVTNLLLCHIVQIGSDFLQLLDLSVTNLAINDIELCIFVKITFESCDVVF